MTLSLYKKEIFEEYHSNSQRVRVLTENWMTQNMFCPVCSNNHINSYPNNHPVADYFCPKCSEQFQLKSQKTSFGKKINDGAYGTMINSIKNMIRPNFFLLKYNLDYLLTDLMLIPGFFFTESLIEKRKPLSKDARRAGWIGCNILINKIPPEGRIKVIENNHWIKRENILNDWKKVNFIKSKPLNERGWTIDVLNAVHSLDKREFTLKEIYEYEEMFAKKHPDNHHIKDKIRQQLQILRDKGLLKFKERGSYISLK